MALSTPPEGEGNPAEGGSSRVYIYLYIFYDHGIDMRVCLCFILLAPMNFMFIGFMFFRNSMLFYVHYAVSIDFKS